MGDSNLVPNEQLSADQVAKLLLNAGFTPDQSAQMTAVAQNESGFNAGILNNTPATGDYSVGLFQINYAGNLAPSRTQEFGSPASLAADPQAQANAAHTLFEQSGYGPWQADWINGSAQRNLPTGVAAVNDVQSGKIVTVDSATGNLGGASGMTNSPVGSGTYQAAGSAFGKILQQLDGFYNPKTTVVPTWVQIVSLGAGTAANDAVATAVTFLDRIVGVVFGAGLVYIGIKLFSGGNSDRGPSTVNTALRVGGNVLVGREANAARVATAETRAATTNARTQAQARASAMSAQQREADRIQRSAQEAVRVRQRATDAAQRQTQQDRQHKLAQQRTRLAAQAEARRQAESGRTTRRKYERETR